MRDEVTLYHYLYEVEIHPCPQDSINKERLIRFCGMTSPLLNKTDIEIIVSKHKMEQPVRCT